MLRTILLCCFFAVLAFLSHSPTPLEAAGLLVAEGGFGGLLEVEEHSVDVTINNGVAVTTVDQTFRNAEQRQVEALYVFPVPNGASVANFSMWINGKEMIGEVVEKERARRVYESYKQTRVDPGLLEQKDYKTFEMRIFPINAGAQQRVRIRYYQQLEFDADRATYVYPLATSAHTGAGSRTTGRLALTMRVLSETPIVDLDSPSHGDEFVAVSHSPHFFEASYETRGGELTRDFVLTFQTHREQTGVDLVTSRPSSEDGYFMMTVTAGDELAKHNSAADYVFVLDVSGSMGFGNKLSLSRESIAAFIETLGPEDRVELMTFNLRPRALFGELRSANDEALGEATRFLRTQEARGGTVLRHAMQTAYGYGDPDRRLNVVLLSDGMTEQQDRAELLRLIRQRPANATVFAVGVGNEVDRPLLKQLAEDAGGLAAFLSEGDDFDRQAMSFRRKLVRPAATNVRLNITGAETYDITPKIIPNLYHGAPVRVYGRYRGAGPFEVKLTGDANGKPYQQRATLEASKDENPEIERMWAQRRIESLLREADRGGARDRVKGRVVQLAEDYSIVTEYTSFIVLENDEEYRRWKIDRKNSRRLDRDRRHEAELNRRLESIRKDSLANIGPGAAKPGSKKQTMNNTNSPTTHETPEPSTLLLLLLGAWPLLARRPRRG